MAAETELKIILQNAGLPALITIFCQENVEAGMILNLTDDDLSRLGVSTVGQRIRIREAAKQQKIASNQGSQSAVFPGFRNISRPNTRTKKKATVGSWTAQFFCLSSLGQHGTPNHAEKDTLNKAGLGLKKVKVGNLCTESEVIDILQGEEGFPRLKNSGGFEFLRTQQNGRNLIPIPGPWSGRELKMNIGSQARIYLRPIQHSLSLEPITVENTGIGVKIPCEKCLVEYPLQELRIHVQQCRMEPEAELPDISVFLNYEPEDPPHLPGNNQLYTFSVDTANEDTVVIPDPVIINNHTSTTTSVHDIVEECISYCHKNDITNPVEILRKAQSQILIGRPLDLEDTELTIEGETNYVTVDRNNIHVLKTGIEEIGSCHIEDLRKTLEVQFYNEQACDYGGPRKEFFRLVLIEIKEKYFDSGLRDLLAEDYKTIGIIFALSILQNGKMPTFLSPDLVGEIFDGSTPTSSNAVLKLREGLNVLGIYELFQGLPELKFLLQSPANAITTKRVITMLQPNFSAEGSNAIQFEKEVYSLFIKYLREVAAGRRGSLTLSSILQFVTGADEEPVLGFKIHPSIHFVEVKDGFLPTASTCVNSLTVPRPSQTIKMPKTEEVFNFYDYAFSNTFYGLQ